MKDRKPETENGKPEISEIGPDRFSFPVSRVRFPVSGFLPVWFRLVRVREDKTVPAGLWLSVCGLWFT
jgi:hypothetical protein